MSPSISAILTNREVIAVNQDKAGQQGKRISQAGEQEVWARPLADGAQAVGLFNRSSGSAQVMVKWADLGFKRAPGRVRDLWAHSDLKLDGPAYSAGVPPHGVVMLRVNR